MEDRVAYMKTYNNRYYQEHQEEIRAKARERHRAKIAGKAWTPRFSREGMRQEVAMLDRAIRRAKARGLPCTITRSDVKVPVLCPYLGIPLVFGDGSTGPGSPSLDRIDPDLGYTPENVRVISHLANSMKNSASLSQLETFCRNAAALHGFNLG